MSPGRETKLEYWRIVLIIAITAVDAAAQRAKPVIDPETPHGYLIQRIQQEDDENARIDLMVEFATQFPKHESLGWVLDRLIPATLKARQWDRAAKAGELMLSIEPENVTAAQACLQAAEGRKDGAAVERFALLLWDVAQRKALSGKPDSPDEIRQVQTYAEYYIFQSALSAADPKKRTQLLHALETRNPKSQYLKSAQGELIRTFQSQGDFGRAAAAAEKVLAGDPNNEDMHMVMMENYSKRGDNPDRLAFHASRIIEILSAKPRPESTPAAEWEAKKAQYLFSAYYSGGIAASLMNRFSTADRMLRASLPYLKDPAVQAAVYYHLGYANYKLAEAGERGRVPDALKFNQLCVTIKSNYQEQALKNIAAIKSEYNLQ
ncbi:MAG: hypothetical protein K2X35_17655 [Bryobacteraceae bacterium]|nr:hypothetical protein [Bryobacteraceae bacterium]